MPGASGAVYGEHGGGLGAHSRTLWVGSVAPPAPGVCLLSFRLWLRLLTRGLGLCDYAARATACLHRADPCLSPGGRVAGVISPNILRSGPSCPGVKANENCTKAPVS